MQGTIIEPSDIQMSQPLKFLNLSYYSFHGSRAPALSNKNSIISGYWETSL
jgi:hypothetical protein